LLAELRQEVDQWHVARQQCSECKLLLAGAVATAVDVHKRALEEAAEETLK
jgi:hypothetical protein